MGKYVAEYSPGSSSGYSNCCEALVQVADASISDFNAINARLEDTVVDMLSSLIFTVSVVDESMWYGPSMHRSNFEYGSVACRLVCVTANGG